jgi:hypothetical protein
VKAAWVLLIALSGTSGCYKYVAAEPSSLSNGREVAIDLSSAGTVNVRPAIGDFVSRVEGTVTQSSSSGITLALHAVRRRGEVASSTWKGESLELASGDIASVRTKEFSKSRTTASAVALGGLGVGLVIALAKAVGLLENSGGSGKPIPPP